MHCGNMGTASPFLQYNRTGRQFDDVFRPVLRLLTFATLSSARFLVPKIGWLKLFKADSDFGKAGKVR